MKFKLPIVFAVLFLLAAGGLARGFAAIARVKQANREASRTVTELEATASKRRKRVVESAVERHRVERELIEARARFAALDGSPIRIWAFRVALLQRLMAELPGQRIPEIALLTTLDWADIVRTAELDSAATISSALSAVRGVARRVFAPHLQAALRRFTEVSGGRLPKDIGELAPFLAAPATAEMLGRYRLARDGALGDSGEKLIVEIPGADWELKVALSTWSIEGKKLSMPTDDGSLERYVHALGKVVPYEALTSDTMQLFDGFGQVAKQMTDGMEADMSDAFADELKRAVGRFQSAHPGETITNVAQVAPYFADREKLVSALRPMVANLTYLMEHHEAPSDPAKLKPYLERPIDEATLRRLELTVTDKSFTVSYSSDNAGK